MGSTSLYEMPNEILFSIFSYLKLHELKYVVPNVCKQWKILSKDRRLWKRISFQTTSDATRTFGARSWKSTLKFIETTPELQCIVISQGHTDNEVREILNSLNRFCDGVRRIELDLTPSVAKHIANLPNLTKQVTSLILRLTPERSQKDVYKYLANFHYLTEVVFLLMNPHHKVFQSFLNNCNRVEHLTVANDEFSKKSFLMLLKRKDQFRSLILRVDSLDRQCISELSRFPNLVRLELADTNASPDKLVEIGNLACLETLLLREDASSPVLTSAALTVFLQCGKFDRLKELRLHKSRLNDEGAAAIRRNCPVLTYLEVITYPKSRSDLTEKGLVHILHCKRLENIEVTFDGSYETDWIYRRVRYDKHDCDVDGECPLSLNELLLSWDEIQIPMD